MAAIRSRGNQATELKFAGILRSAGITGWRRHQPLPGRPDFVFRRARLAVFVDGCFWHGCRWHCRMPKSRGAYWNPKIDRNKARDRTVRNLLIENGWRVLRIWEHSLQTPEVVVIKMRAALAKPCAIAKRRPLNVTTFEQLLGELCTRLTDECRSSSTYDQSKSFENRVREVIRTLLVQFKIPVDFSPHPYGFPDIVLGQFGIEVKFTTNDTWRSVANSVFESFRNKDVRHIYVVFGKMGGQREVRWGRHEECVMHVRTSHVPRFEVDLEAQESLFMKFGITYDQFCQLSLHDRMEHIRKYARSRLKKGERLWWLEDRPDQGHSLPLQVRLFAHLTDQEKRNLRAEMSLLCPQIVRPGGVHRKFSDAYMFALTYRGVLCSRDAFSAGSAVGPKRGGNYVKRALQVIEKEMRAAAQYLDDALFVEYWGLSVSPENRIREWLKRADELATTWVPSKELFIDNKARA